MPFHSPYTITFKRTALIPFLCTPLVFIASNVDAVTLDGTQKTVTSVDAPDTYNLINGAQLDAVSATLLGLSANRSTLNVTGGTVSSTGAVAVRLTSGTGNFANTTINNTVGGGLLAARVTNLQQGSQVVVSDSDITGNTYGLQMTGYSTVRITDSQVVGTGTDRNAVNNFSGQLQAVGSRFTGEANGVRLARDTSTMGLVSSLSLEGSSVIGKTGAGVRVDSGSVAQIDVLNNSQLNGGNGNALEVAAASQATMNVRSSALSGDVLVTDTSSATVSLDQASLTGNLIGDDSAAVVLILDQSTMSGDVRVAPGGSGGVTLGNNSQLTGRLEHVQQVNINSNSNWTLNANNTIGDLAMNGGRITFGDENSFYELNVQSLSGNGEFYMASNFASGATDFLNVTGNASGTHGLMVGTSGTDPASVERLQLVHTGSGDAQFSLLNDRQEVDLGAYSYKLVKDGQDWYLDRETRTISPMTRTVMALFNTPITIAYGEMTSLRSRMGELRYNQGKNAGVWMRAYGNQHNIADASSGVGYQQNQRGLTFGADAQLGESNWTLGLLAGHSRSDLNLSYGSSGSIDSYYVGGYATWMDPESGYYVDSVLKYNRYQNDAKVGLSDGTRTKGDYDTHGMSASVEVGKHIKLDDGYFIEPFAQVAAAAVAGKDFTLDNGFDANGDVSRSLLGKVGTTLGKTISLGGDSMIQPYVKAAFAHEFAQRNQVQVNNNVFNNDLSGSRAELGAGVAWTVAKDFQVYGEAGYMNGKNIEMPYSFSLGASYRF